MPSIGSVLQTAVPAGTTLAQYLATRGGLNRATNTINAGVGNAQTALDSAARTATNAQTGALDTQRGLYTTTTEANAPYQQTGLTANSQLQGLIADPNSLTNDPGYQFELDQGLKGQQRQASAAGTFGNGGTIKAATRYALDYANTKYNDAVNRLLQVTQVGQRANAANQEAANTFGGQVGTEATNVGNIGTRNAEDQASLTLAQAQLNANNQVAQSQDTSNLIKTLTPTIAQAAAKYLPGIFGAGTAAATAAAPTIASVTGGAVPALPTLAGATPALASTALPASTGALGAEGAGVGSSVSGSGGIAASSLHALSALAANPITWGVAAAIGGALIWRSTQTHQTADTFVKNYQNPFGQHLGSVVDSFDKALASGQLTKEQAQTARDETAQLIQQFEADGQKFAQKGDKEASVWNQAQRTMAENFGGQVDAKGHKNNPDWSKILGKMDQEIAQLPAQAA